MASGELTKPTEARKVGFAKDQQSARGSQGRPEGSIAHKHDRGLGVTLFIENIPRRMHWKGLWHMFARHGEVNRAFMVKKMSRGGKRFGFVSFGTKCDTSRAMGRLNVFNVYGYRLTVKFSNQNKWRVSGKHNRDQSNIGENDLRQPRNNQTLRRRNQGV
ncbi:hypothetical protein V6N13_124252 [Hibiscus sabdariffa]